MVSFFDSRGRMPQGRFPLRFIFSSVINLNRFFSSSGRLRSAKRYSASSSSDISISYFSSPSLSPGWSPGRLRGFRRLPMRCPFFTCFPWADPTVLFFSLLPYTKRCSLIPLTGILIFFFPLWPMMLSSAITSLMLSLIASSIFLR